MAEARPAAAPGGGEVLQHYQELAMTAALGEARSWLQGELVAERAAMSYMLEQRHLDLMAKLQGRLTAPKLLAAIRNAKEPQEPTKPDNAINGSAGRKADGVAAGGAVASDGEVERGAPRTDGHPVSCLSGSTEGASAKPALPNKESGVDSGQARLDQSRTSLRTSTRTQELDIPQASDVLSRKHSGFMDSADDGPKECEGGLNLKAIVTGSKFEITFGVLIILNTLIMAVQRQYEGMETAYAIGYPTQWQDPAESWPGAEDAFLVLDMIFGIIFTSEVVIKFMVLRCQMYMDTWWNWYDTIIVLFWLVGKLPFLDIVLAIDPMMLRLARISRLLRLLRILRWVEIFDPLHLMVKAIKASISVLMWSLILLILVIAVIAMMVSQILQPWIRNDAYDIDSRWAVYEHWGSFSRAVETMFEITTANWGPPCRLLMNDVDEWWVTFFLTYKLTVGFAVVQVIIAVFIQQTFKVASRDEEVMIKEKAAAGQAFIKNLDNLFKVLDTSGDGLISRDEFEQVLTDTRVRTWFAALEVDVGEVGQLWDLLDDGDGQIEHIEFLQGIKALKGAAKGTDMLALTRDVKRANKVVLNVNDKLDHLIVKSGERRHFELDGVESI